MLMNPFAVVALPLAHLSLCIQNTLHDQQTNEAITWNSVIYMDTLLGEVKQIMTGLPGYFSLNLTVYLLSVSCLPVLL